MVKNGKKGEKWWQQLKNGKSKQKIKYKGKLYK